MRHAVTRLAIAALSAPAAAQVSISVIAPAQVYEGETFTVTVAASASVDNVGATGLAVRITGDAQIVEGSVVDLLNPDSPPAASSSSPSPPARSSSRTSSPSSAASVPTTASAPTVKNRSSASRSRTEPVRC